MNRCPITYSKTDGIYSKRGLSLLSSGLKKLTELPYSAQEQRRQASTRGSKMSVQGVQPKLSARLSVKDGAFEIVDIKGMFIVKPQSDIYEQIPENEDLTMKMAKIYGIETPVTGLIRCIDRSYSYFIKRFDRYAKNKKYALEDFAQLTGNTRDTKYSSSMERLITVIDKYCTFPAIEKRKLFRRVLFCFLTGNEDMHLKNFSLITRGNKTELSPAYDLLNTTIAIGNPKEDLALPMKGKKSKITKELLFNYYAKERLGLNDKVIDSEISNMNRKKNELTDHISISFLNDKMKKEYRQLLEERYKRMLNI